MYNIMHFPCLYIYICMYCPLAIVPGSCVRHCYSAGTTACACTAVNVCVGVQLVKVTYDSVCIVYHTVVFLVSRFFSSITFKICACGCVCFLAGE